MCFQRYAQNRLRLVNILLLPYFRAKLEEKRKKEEEKRVKEEEKRLKEEKDVSSAKVMSFYCNSAAAASLTMCFFFQRIKAEKAEITRFLQKAKIQQAPKVRTSHNVTCHSTVRLKSLLKPVVYIFL